MIYSKILTGKHVRANYFKDGFFKNISEFNDDKDAIFFYDQHDYALHNIRFNECLSLEHWQYFKDEPNTKILIYFADEFFHIKDVIDIAEGIKLLGLDTSRIYFLVMDNNFKEFADTNFEKLGVKGVNVQEYNVLMNNVQIMYNPYFLDTVHKFSSLSRNFRIWRLQLYAELFRNDLLKHFIYSFDNKDPYSDVTYPIETLPSLLKTSGYNEIDDALIEWLSHAPYSLGDFNNKYSNTTYESILKSDFHILIESHFDPFIHDTGERYITPVEDYSPAFPTEKTYKVIACSRPFIAHSTPYFLKGLRQLGYQTFSPFIDESYDLIEDNTERLNAIVKEVNRICLLDKTKYDTIVSGCKEIAQFNQKLLIQSQEETKFNENFNFLVNIFKK
jgi:hypothetical protein